MAEALWENDECLIQGKFKKGSSKLDLRDRNECNFKNINQSLSPDIHVLSGPVYSATYSL